jgi:hypothetical protein
VFAVDAPRLKLQFLRQKRARFFVGECLVCTTENIFEVKGDVAWLEGTHIEEVGPKKVMIATVEAVPELDIAFRFCQVASVNEGVAVVCERLVVL